MLALDFLFIYFFKKETGAFDRVEILRGKVVITWDCWVKADKFVPWSTFQPFNLPDPMSPPVSPAN